MKEFEIKNASLHQARIFLSENWEEGVICPCCKQSVKLYKRTISSSMALGLFYLYKIAGKPNNYIHVPREFTKHKINYSNIELSKLLYWGLVTEKPAEEDQNNNGYWAITSKGELFVLNKLRVPKYVFIYNSKQYLRKNITDTINIIDALGNKYDYGKLMEN